MTFWTLTTPFYSPDDMGGSPGGDTGAVVDSGTSGGGTAVAEPTVYEVDDDTLIRPKGSDKPIKFSEHVKGFQANYTKAAQRAAQLERQLQEREQRLQQIE